mmetsp:Transcript_15755/g.40303  ORF Transcript_15755/g.40303 Transcript_15755/m.40303 type:complete len:107 (-) Transcript_15755:18-338(-)
MAAVSRLRTTGAVRRLTDKQNCAPWQFDDDWKATLRWTRRILSEPTTRKEFLLFFFFSFSSSFFAWFPRCFLSAVQVEMYESIGVQPGDAFLSTQSTFKRASLGST